MSEQTKIPLNLILEIICEKLQITESQYNLAKDKYETIGKWLAAIDSPLYAYSPNVFPQGSFRIGTTVKPISWEEYDIDLVCQFMKDGSITEPMKFLDMVYARISSSGLYRDIVEKKNRCVRINYKGNFHLDILPARSDPSSTSSCILVPDRRTKNWKPSNPIGYAEWFEGRATVPIKLLKDARMEPLPQHQTLSDKLPLQQTIQLIKRWRDIIYKNNSDFAPPSIVLSTLAAKSYKKELLVTDSMTTILSSIINELNISSKPIFVKNPANAKECLSEKWIQDEKKYFLFKNLFSEFKNKWDNLFYVRGIDKLAKILKELFEESVVTSAFKKYAETIEDMRNKRNLGINKTTRALTSLTSGVVTIRKNTFYGE